MRQRICKIGCSLVIAALSCTSAYGGVADNEGPQIDARLDGYADSANMYDKDASGTGFTWILLLLLGGTCVGVTFINAKRTHLD